MEARTDEHAGVAVDQAELRHWTDEQLAAWLRRVHEEWRAVPMVTAELAGRPGWTLKNIAAASGVAPSTVLRRVNRS
jgi:hypothetical protein